MLDSSVMTMHACCICSQIAGHAENDLIARLLPDQPYVRRILLEDDVFAVIPSLGPLTAGHSLLCPKSHIRSFASLDAELHAHYAKFRAALCEALQSLYGHEVHVFEHGMAREGDRIVCTVDHAHMHFVPLPGEVEIPFREQWTAFDGSLESLRALAGDSEYVLYSAPDEKARVLTANGMEIESQFMRRLIAEGLGHRKWNWRTAPHAHAADEAWRRFSGVR